MDVCATPNLLSLEDAIATMSSRISAITTTEWVDLHAALDRVLASDIVAPINVPGGNNSAMDGYAFRHQDADQELNIQGEAFAGHPFNGELKPGGAVRIMTGALIPSGADTVVMQENVAHYDNKIRINVAPIQGDNIRRAGEDITQGALVLPAGQMLTALDLGLIASLGVSKISVFERVKVALLTTGDELLAPGAEFLPGKIFDSNRPLLKALLTRLPVEVMDLGIIPDDPETLRNAFLNARDHADLVISTGGVSVGDADYTTQILSSMGSIRFWKIAMKPGKPFAFGDLGQNSHARPCWFCGLPGNPVSTAVTYRQLVVPALRRLAGETFANEVLCEPVVIKTVAAKPLKKAPGRVDFQRGILVTRDGITQVESAGPQGSGVLSSMHKANCFIRLERERGNVAAGETVDVIPFDHLIR